jgi:HD-like signal output (HDOD) protein
MLGRLVEYFSKSSQVSTTPVPPAESDKVISLDEDADFLFDNWTEIEQSFMGMLLGVNSLVDGPMSKDEKLSLDSINKEYLLNNSADYQIPRLPAVIPKVLQLLRDKETDTSSLAKIVSADMVLVSEVIRLANSAYYNRSRPYDSLEQAIVNIGFNGIRQLIVSAALKPILSAESGRFSNITNRYLWDKSMTTALLNDCVANALGENRFYAYLSGLVVQSGMTVLSKELDNCFDDEEVPNNKLYIEEVSRYTYTLSAEISKQWQFPQTVTNTLQEQVSCENPLSMSNLGRITYLSDKLVKTHLLVSNGHAKTFDSDVSKLIQGDMHDVYLRCQEQLGINK